MASERPVSVRAVIRPGRVSAFHSNAVIGLEWVEMTATDRKRPLPFLTRVSN